MSGAALIRRSVEEQEGTVPCIPCNRQFKSKGSLAVLNHFPEHMRSKLCEICLLHIKEGNVIRSGMVKQDKTSVCLWEVKDQ